MAVHTNDHDYARAPETLDDKEADCREIFTSTKYETVHPAVHVHPDVHPVTGKRGLFSGGESRDLLRLRHLALHTGGGLTVTYAGKSA